MWLMNYKNILKDIEEDTEYLPTNELEEYWKKRRHDADCMKCINFHEFKCKKNWKPTLDDDGIRKCFFYKILGVKHEFITQEEMNL